MWEVMLLNTLLYGVKNNLTTNEMGNRHRYHYLLDSTGMPRNPFDKGFEANVKELIWPTIDWYNFYNLPNVIMEERSMEVA